MSPVHRRVMLVTTSLIRGGAETQVFLLARAFRARGHEVHVVSMLAPEAYAEELRALGAEVSSLDVRRGAIDPRGVARLARLVRSWRPDVVHAHMVHANLLARVARPFGWAPVLVSTAHNLTEGARWREIAYRVTDPLTTLTTNVCRVGAERYVAIGATPAGKMRPMANGIEVGLFRRPPETRAAVRASLAVGERFVWLAVGRLQPQKDYPNMLRALADTRRSGVDGVLLVVGEGPDRDAIERDAAELGLDRDTVRFLGARTDVADLMAAADGYLMSSAWEGLPLVLLEAGASALPVVATAVGGNDEIVEPARTGFLVPPHDTGALASAMRRLATMAPEARQQMGAAARRLVAERFDIEPVADHWIDLYEELLARVGRG